MRNKALVFSLVIVPLFLCVVVACLTASSSFQYEHQGEDFEVRPDGTLISKKYLNRRKMLAEGGPLPRAETNEAVHDFGVMDPLTMGRHSFKIRNTGEGPLLLRKGPTTCKCTLSDLSQDAIEPGEEATVTLEWNTGRKHRLYSHEATIYSNDPRRESIDLRVQGVVRFYASTHPKEPTFGEIRPDKHAASEVIVYSQIWDTFDLRGGSCTLEGLTWEAEEVDDETLASLEATAGFRLKLHLPANMGPGEVGTILRLEVDAADNADPEKTEVVEYDVPISARILRRLALYGPGIDQFGLLELGRIRSGEGLQRRLVAKVRDDDRELKVTKITTKPEFIKVSFSEVDEDSSTIGLWHFNVEIPPGTPPGIYSRVNEATIQVDFDHPRIDQLKLRSRFTIVE